MKRIGLTAITLPALVATQASASSTRHAPPAKCPPGHTHLITADAQAQVYEGGEEDEVFGCTYAKKRSFTLGLIPNCGSSGCEDVKREVLAGPIVAYE